MSAVLKDLQRASVVATLPGMSREDAIAKARQILAPVLQDRPPVAYPIEALGPLAAPCSATAELGQVRPAMVGQCMLGAASLLTQGLYNVETLNGDCPLSLYLLTLGESGDGKSTADRAAMKAITDWQRQAAKKYSAAMREYEQVKTRRGKSDDPPQPPDSPYRVVSDPTVEGLRRDLERGPCSQGVFTDEAAAILGGYGMSPEQRGKTASVYSRLWDRGHLSVSRATGARVERFGLRVAMHWLVQPAPATESMQDPMLSSLGFWPRFLLAWPEPAAPRLARPFVPESSPAIKAYWERCQELLAMPLAEDASDCPRITLEAPARELLGKAFERFEVEGKRGSFTVIKPFALRAAEQACRIAGVLAAFERREAVNAQLMRHALALVSHALDNWRSVFDGAVASREGALALRLYEWLTTRPDWSEPLASILRNVTPADLRSKERRDAALGVLREAGLVDVTAGAAKALPPHLAEVTS